MIAFTDQQSDQENDEVIRIPKQKALHSGLILFEYVKVYLNVNKAVKKILDGGFTPDLIISFNNPMLSRVAEKYRRENCAKHIIHIGHLMAESKIYSRNSITRLIGYAARYIRNRQLKKADQIWVMSPEMKRYFSNIIRKEKIKIWPSAVSTEFEPSYYQTLTDQLKVKLQIDVKDKIIIYIGTLNKIRGLEFVLNSMKRVLEKKTNVKLLFIGYTVNSNDLDFLIDYAKRVKIQDNVIFHPPVSEDELPYYIKIADVGISPFKPTFVLKHNSPLKLLEYFKAGIPVVATDTPDQQLILEESKAGILVKWDETEFADAIVKILSFSLEEKRKIGSRGYDWVKQNREIEQLTRTMANWFQELRNSG